ncbi:N-acetyl-gamma-glutamyl-phosphate reductase [Thermohalobacter berrensis]|uniref:N-acetyl-gamma-glutamyl-phosphate reductase n=1 Tax=Thermohalobacter berrensis TaxID=99594 RepID=A0A419T4T2_9FIRM|nr:N-acetyl-gamma-glutamyl-phosphate reductase [Thermohalobacter berrensis]RKD32557.1 N-acetyl-gamma-glutamyl-phosphate reductase [Thermohalobacter berrensis]
MIKVGIVGATGYAGQQLLWLLFNHSKIDVCFLSSYNYANSAYSQVYPQYNTFINKYCIDMQTAEKKLPMIDVLFSALPHGKFFPIIEKALNQGVKVIDLSADFRIKDSNVFKKWYQIEHPKKYLLKNSVYGLPELYKEKIRKAKLVANPGCYPTASILALAPLVNSQLVDLSSIIIDAKSGISGAGRKPKLSNVFSECNESIRAYSVTCHRHTAEIEQEISNLYGDKINLSFIPHLIPMNRGILATCYVTLKKNISEESLYSLYEDFYRDEYFVRITSKLPETKWVKRSNLCDIGIRVDKRTSKVLIISAIDNLIKGAAGQAVQNMNIMFGFEETEGLKLISITP